MQNKTHSLFNKAVSLVLAIMMVFSVISVMPEKVSAAEFSFKGSGTSSVTIADAQSYVVTGDYNWIQFKAKADGYVQFSIACASALDNYSTGGWMLCNSSRTQISTYDKFDTSSTNAFMKNNVYGVQKGKTYYLRVLNDLGVTVTAKFTAVKENSGSKKSKAKDIKKGKTVKGTIAAGTKKADWYKFKLTKTQTVKVSYAAKTNNELKITLYEGSRDMGFVKMDFTSSKKESTYIVNAYTKKKTKVKAGTTYYVKVEPMDTNSSGYYTFSWK